MSLTNKENAKKSDEPKLHIIVVEKNVGKMGGKQCVDSTGRTHQVHVRVKNACTQRACQHARHVHTPYAEGAMDHFQGQPDQQLDHQIEHQVHPSVHKTQKKRLKNPSIHSMSIHTLDSI